MLHDEPPTGVLINSFSPSTVFITLPSRASTVQLSHTHTHARTHARTHTQPHALQAKIQSVCWETSFVRQTKTLEQFVENGLKMEAVGVFNSLPSHSAALGWRTEQLRSGHTLAHRRQRAKTHFKWLKPIYIFWLKQRRAFQLHFSLKMATLLYHPVLRGHNYTTSFWRRYAQFWNLFQNKAPWLYFFFVGIDENPQNDRTATFVTLLSERVRDLRELLPVCTYLG